ncbi:MAG: EamA family transporter, partial [Peptoniphilus sp.]|nr:EamA family transporter [Peptoniphilus sp.]
SIILTLGGASLYQKSISLIGAKNTSMLSTLEPIVSIILGYFILREQLGFNQIIAVLCIVVANFLLIKSN